MKCEMVFGGTTQMQEMVPDLFELNKVLKILKPGQPLPPDSVASSLMRKLLPSYIELFKWMHETGY